MSEGFQFKHFYVRHDRCAMKVGTDGVLLGALAEELMKEPAKLLRIRKSASLTLGLAPRFAH